VEPGSLPVCVYWRQTPLIHRLPLIARMPNMDPLEAQAKAIIAAALIVRGAVEVPSVPPGGQRVPDGAGMRLRELTDYLYRLLTTEHPHDP